MTATVTYCNFNIFALTGVQGATGAIGATGTTGNPGATGATGPAVGGIYFAANEAALPTSSIPNPSWGFTNDKYIYIWLGSSWSAVV